MARMRRAPEMEGMPVQFDLCVGADVAIETKSTASRCYDVIRQVERWDGQAIAIVLLEIVKGCLPKCAHCVLS